MKSSQISLTIEDIFKGLNKDELTYILTLLPGQIYTQESLNNAINDLIPRQQLHIDELLKKARRIQQSRFHIKRILLTVSFILLTVLIICLAYYLKGV